MTPFQNDPGPPRRNLWDRLAYILVAVLLWAAVAFESFGGAGS